MFYYLSKDLEQHISFYKEILKRDFLVFGIHNIPLEVIVRKKCFHPIFQLVFLDALRKNKKIKFQEMKFSIRLDKSELLGVKKIDFYNGEISQEFVSECINDEVFFDSIRSHSIWFRLSSFLNLSLDGEQASILGFSLFMRHVFWQKKLVSDYGISPDDTELFALLMNNIVESFYSMTDIEEKSCKFLTDRESRKVIGLDGVDDIGEGVPEIINEIINDSEIFSGQKNNSNSAEDCFDFDEIEITDNSDSQRQIKKIKNDCQIELSLSSKGYREFISRLVLVTFGRLMIESGLDLKSDADQIFGKIELSFFDIQAAAFSSAFISERWALNLKKTSSSLIYHSKVYDLYERMTERFSTRTYDHPKRGSTTHCFRHLVEYEEAVHKKLIKFIQGINFEYIQMINDESLPDLLWSMLSNENNCNYSSYFIKSNNPQDLHAIKLACSKICEYLHDNIKGQDEAIRQIINAEMWSKFKSSKGLRGLFTFLGPSGVGKTHLAKTYAESLKLFDLTGYKIQVFNMESYSDERAPAALIGSGSQYTDASAGELTFNVHLYPRTVIVFDEIEKAHPNVIQTLLTLIDTGRLVDATSRIEVDFSQCVIIFTSNLGHEIFDKAKDLGELDVFDVLRKAKLRNSDSVALSPEFVNRLGAGSAVRFLPLNTRSLLDIARLQVKDLDLDNGGLIDYILDPDLAAILLFLQLPQPTVRALKSKQSNLVSEAKQLLFSNSELDSSLNNIEKLRINVHPSCFEIQQAGRILIVGGSDVLTQEVSSTFVGYQLLNTDSFETSRAPVSTSKTNAIIIFDSFPEKDILNAQIEYGVRHFGEIPLLVISSDSKEYEHNASIWMHSHSGLSDVILSKFKHVVDVHRRLELAKQKQQGFSYRLELTEVSTDCVTFTVTNPRFNLQISTTRAEEGVTGLVKERPDIRLNDVIGLQRAKTHLQRVIKWLKHPELLASQNIAFPAGMLLAGPPGTGKTLLAKAVAGECELPFISLSVGDLISGVRNGTAEKIDKAFKQASDIAPCIMFIDEIDTIATARRAGEISDNNAVNVLLTHLDGIQKRSEPIFVLAATNFPQVLDQALLRAGRLDEIIYCDLPDKAARSDFFLQLSKKYSISIDAEEMGKYVDMTQGMSGAQLDKIFRDYLYRVSGEEYCQLADSTSSFHQNLFREAIINIRYGSANPNKVLSAESKVQVAWHEAGHLLMTKLLLPQHAITFATIEPRNQSLGFVSIQRDDTAGSSTASEVKAQIAVAMAGREAERLLSENYDVAAGAVSDIEVATRYAMHAVCEWGLDPEFGQLSASVLNYQTTSAELQKLAELRIRFWLEEGQQKAAEILFKNKQLLQEIAEQLIEKESLYADEIECMFNCIN